MRAAVTPLLRCALSGFAAAALAVAAAVVVEIALPGRAVYHAGWYNVLLGALVVVSVAAGRRLLVASRDHARARRDRRRSSSARRSSDCGRRQRIACARQSNDRRRARPARPRRRARHDSSFRSPRPECRDRRRSRSSVPFTRRSTIGERARNSREASSCARMPRNVVYVEARDPRGNRLTITQPTGTVFLSPVLLMQHRQTIAGMDLPFDSFNVPAARRVVKAVSLRRRKPRCCCTAGRRPARRRCSLPSTMRTIGRCRTAIATERRRANRSRRRIAACAAWSRYPAVEVVAVPNIACDRFRCAARARRLADRRAIDRPRSRERCAARCCPRRARSFRRQDVDRDQTRRRVSGGKRTDDRPPARLAELRRIDAARLR